jgi:hypothetical protein
MVKKLLVGTAAVVVIAAVVVALQPSAFVVERSVSIDAPAARIYPRIASVRAMDQWSPWVKLDPQMQTVYDGPESGVGSRSSWEGPQMGKGRVTVTSALPDTEIEMKLEMLEPMEGTNRVLFTLVPRGAATDVTWRMEGTNGFAGKAMGLVMSMDRMIGDEFSKGLAALKAQVESGPSTGS